MQPLPSGRLALLLTDIEGSTALWESDPGAMDAAMRRHDEVIASVVHRCGGVLVRSKGEGDSSFSVFADPAAAVEAGIAVVADLARGPHPLSLRAGIHVGDVEARAGDYYGPVPNRAARVRGLAGGGQLLLSGSAANAVDGRLPPGTELVDLGQHELRGLALPEYVFGVSHPDLPPVAAIGPPMVPPSNLPAPLDSFVGREEERRLLEKALAARRLVTVTGTGGVGKSRLVAEVAADLAHARPGGTFLVDVSTLADEDALVAAVAVAVGLTLAPGQDPVEALAATLAEPAMLILDTCEHVLDAASAAAARLLARIPNLHIAATSREPLRAPGEAVLRLAPMPVEAPPGEVSEAALLFLARAEAASLGAAFDHDHEHEAAGRIGRLLDGIPLAIELAAARLSEVDIGVLESELSDVLERSGERRGGPQRQRTLRATIAWSVDALPSDQREVLRRLAVFRGGWPDGAAEVVCAAAGPNVAAALDGLVTRSLVDRQAGRGRLLDSIRSYVGELSDVGDDVNDAHLDWAAQQAGALEAAAQIDPRWPQLSAAEQANLMHAIDRAEATARADDAQTIAVALTNLWLRVSALDVARTTLARVIALGGGGEPRARALAAAALVATVGGEPAEAHRYIAEALDIVATATDVSPSARIEIFAGATLAASINQDDATALRHARAALDVARLAGDGKQLSQSLSNVACLLGPDEHREQVELMREAAALEEQLGVAVTCRANLAQLELMAGRPARALAVLDRLELGGDEVAGANERCHIQRVRAGALLRLGSVDAACATAAAAVALHRSSGVRWGMGESVTTLGEALFVRGDHAAAAVALEEARHLPDCPATATLRLALVHLAEDRRDEAAALLDSVAPDEESVLRVEVEARLGPVTEPVVGRLRSVRASMAAAGLHAAELTLLRLEAELLPLNAVVARRLAELEDLAARE